MQSQASILNSTPYLEYFCSIAAVTTLSGYTYPGSSVFPSLAMRAATSLMYSLSSGAVLATVPSS